MSATARRYVHAVILDPSRTCVLLGRKHDGTWCLPRADQMPGETDAQTLSRAGVWHINTVLKALFPYGPEFREGNVTDVAYVCEMVAGSRYPGTDFAQLRFCDLKEVEAGSYRVKHKEWSDDGGVGMTAGYATLPLTLAEPPFARKAAAHMVWDALSILQEPTRDHPPFDAPQFFGHEELPDGETRWTEQYIVQRTGDWWQAWPRLRPVTPVVVTG